MRKVFLIPNAITAFGLTCGLFVIFKTSIADPSRDLFTLIQASVILLLIAAVADLADGAVARLIKASSEFGGQFDSLCDAVTFGIAPPLLLLKTLAFGGHAIAPLYIFFVILASMIYSLCGVLRLVRYNIQSKKEEKREKDHFTGLPIPAAASAALSSGLISISPLAMEYFPLSSEVRALILGGILILLGYFMVSRWKFPTVKALHFRVPSFYLVFALGIFAVLVLYGILDYFAEVYFIFSWLYFLISWAIALTKLIAGRKEEEEGDEEDIHEK